MTKLLIIDDRNYLLEVEDQKIFGTNIRIYDPNMQNPNTICLNDNELIDLYNFIGNQIAQKIERGAQND